MMVWVEEKKVDDVLKEEGFVVHGQPLDDTESAVGDLRDEERGQVGSIVFPLF